MTEFIRTITQYNNVWISVILVTIAGILGNYYSATAMLLLVLLTASIEIKPFIILILFLATYYLSDNVGGTFGYSGNFRFIVLGFSLIFLLKHQVFQNNPGNYALPFTIIAVILSYIYSPLGVDAVLRSLGFWLVAITIFRLTDIQFSQFPSDASKVLFIWIVIFFSINLISRYINVIPGVFLTDRFRGLMGNPNGLGLLTLISYPFFDLLRYRNDTQFSQTFFNGAKLLLIIIAVMTGSRNTIISIVIYEMVVRLRHDRAWLFIILVFMSATAYNLFAINIYAIIENLGLSTFFRVESITDLSGRTEVWQVVWAEIKSSPWLGKGMLYDIYFINDYAETYLTGPTERHWAAVWSTYLSLLLDVGIIGMVAYGWFIRKMYLLAQNKQLAFAFLVMSLFSGITESWMAASMNAFMPMFFLYWAIQSQPLNSQPE